ncbi:hypothetical protein E2320_010715, partial [Naja naja]
LICFAPEVSLHYPYPADCSQTQQNGNSISGLYTIYLNGDSNRPLESAHLPYELRVDLQTHNESAYAIYDFFQVGSSRDRYKLSLGNYRGTAGDAMTYHNGRKFTTVDRDNDIAITNCAITHHGGWWYKNCHLANLNGKYGEHKHS